LLKEGGQKMSNISEQLAKFAEENGQEVLAEFDNVLKAYDTPAPLTVIEAKISYSTQPPVGQGKSVIVYEDDECIIIWKK
jgi:hypothetical protein